MLRKLREDAGLGQEDLGKLLGKTQSFVSKCESGDRRLDVIELQEFCRALNIPLSDFVRQLEEAQDLPLPQLMKYLGEEWP